MQFFLLSMSLSLSSLGHIWFFFPSMSLTFPSLGHMQSFLFSMSHYFSKTGHNAELFVHMSRYLSKVGHFNKLFVYMSPWLWKWDISINFLLICPITFKNYTQKHLFSYAISNFLHKNIWLVFSLVVTLSVREYWIVDPRRRTITVNFFE